MDESKMKSNRARLMNMENVHVLCDLIGNPKFVMVSDFPEHESFIAFKSGRKYYALCSQHIPFAKNLFERIKHNCDLNESNWKCFTVSNSVDISTSIIPENLETLALDHVELLENQGMFGKDSGTKKRYIKCILNCNFRNYFIIRNHLLTVS
jgi:hypothetical protein